MRLPDTPADLIRAAQRGDAAAWAALFSAWSPVVLGWCRYLGGSRIDPEDAAHESFVRLHRRFDALHGPEHFRAFLYGITRRVVAEHRRRLWWQRWMPGPLAPRPDPHPDPEQNAALREMVAQIEGLLEKVPPAFREALVLCDVEGLALAEAAELLGVSVGTIKSRLSRGRARFRAEAARRGVSLALALVEEAHG